MRGLNLWLEIDGMRQSAAVAFYAMLSLAPLLVLVVAGLGWWLDRSVVEETLLQQIRDVTGEKAAAVVQHALQSATAPEQGAIATVIAFGVLMSAATGVFVALQDALADIWGVKHSAHKRAPMWQLLVLRLRGMGYVLALGGALMLSLVVSAVLRVLTRMLDDVIANPWFWGTFNEVVGLLFVTLLFVGMMRISDGRKPSLRYLVWGSLIGAVLFTLGKHAMTLYLSEAAVVSAYGAAGSLVALLMWLYFSSAILLLAASLAKAMSQSGAPQVTEAGAAPEQV
ncbi:MAG: YihY/virulence factor BrkB family protein [Comamonadaceae bacterium]|nr:YihY/virulence factor BrkB family protein [Comamonadaceae bacterium]